MREAVMGIVCFVHDARLFPLPLWERVDRTAKRFETGEGERRSAVLPPLPPSLRSGTLPHEGGGEGREAPLPTPASASGRTARPWNPCPAPKSANRDRRA